MTVVIVIKGAENGSGRYLISPISGPWLPGPSNHRHQPTLKTQHHQGKILSFLANFSGRLVTRVYSEAVKFYLTLVNISDPSGLSLNSQAVKFLGIVWSL